MNSCFNCLNFGNPRCILHKDCEKWRPDYLTLEAENTDLKWSNKLLNRALTSACETLSEKDDKKRDVEWWFGVILTTAEDEMEGEDDD
jgi:hypothetical protein